MTGNYKFIAIIVLIGTAVAANAQAAVPVITDPYDSRIIIEKSDLDHDIIMLQHRP